MNARDEEDSTPTLGCLPRAARILFLAAALTSGAAMIWLIHRHQSYSQSTTQASRAQLVALTAKAASAIDQIARHAMGEATAIAQELDAGSLNRKQMLDRIQAATESNPQFYGMTITYRPFGLDPRRRLFSAYFTRKNGSIGYVQLDKVYDYTLPEHEWYGTAMTKGAIWTRPYFDEAGGTTMITYSRPFYGPRGNRSSPLGLVTVDLSLDGIRSVIESLDLGPNGFGSLVSEEGIYLHHPNSELVIGKKTLLELAREQGDPEREYLAAATARREAGILDHQSRTTGLAAWLVFAPVVSTGWSLQNTFIKDDLPLDLNEMKRQQIRILLSAMIFVFSALSLLFRVYAGTSPALWACSTFASILLFIGIGSLWNLSLRFDANQKSSGVKVCDRATLHSVMNSYIRSCETRHTEAPVFIPTGIYLESAHFASADELMLSGYVWQKYRIGIQDHLTRGFTFASATELQITENYREKGSEFDFIRWHFRATLRQRLDHSRYPLELEHIKIRLLHNELNHNVVLVPDLNAFRLTNPASLPGLERGLMLPGWKISSSFFEFLKLRFDTNFGVDRSLAKEDFPSLFYCLVIQRNFVDAFLSNLTPLIIVAILLFTLIMIASRDERLVGFLQAGSGRVLNICAAMFFVIAFSHIDIRRRTASEEVFYLEYFYFLIYFCLLWVSVNSVLFATGTNIRIIQFRENLISKLAYWPFLLGCLFVITLVVFY